MAGFFGLGKKEAEEKAAAEQERIGKTMKNLSDQIASLQQQGQSKDSELNKLKEELKRAEGVAGAGDQAKKQLQAAQAALAVAEADKQAHEIMLKNAQKQIEEMQAQLNALKPSTAAGVVASATAAIKGALGGLAIGSAAWVREEGGKNLRRRSAPGLNSEVLDSLAPGTQLALLEGPNQADGHNWWRVRAADGREGWVAGEELVTKPE